VGGGGAEGFLGGNLAILLIVGETRPKTLKKCVKRRSNFRYSFRTEHEERNRERGGGGSGGACKNAGFESRGYFETQRYLTEREKSGLLPTLDQSRDGTLGKRDKLEFGSMLGTTILGVGQGKIAELPKYRGKKWGKG